MSFAGNPLTYVRREPQTGKISFADRLAVKRKQARERFAKFQADRKNKPALAGIARDEGSLNTCTCGQYKRQSASYCDTCADERSVLHKEVKSAVTEYATPRYSKKPRPCDRNIRRMPAPLKYKSIAATDYANSFLDELVNICEENLSKLD